MGWGRNFGSVKAFEVKTIDPRHLHICKCSSCCFLACLELFGRREEASADVKSLELQCKLSRGQDVLQRSSLANPPERSKDDCNVGTRNGQLSRTGSLTVLRRTNSRKTGSSSSRASSISMESIDSYASADLGVDKLPPVETSEALHACSLRLRNLVRRLEKEDLNKEDMKKNLEYAANVLETVYIDETRGLQDTKK
ncbi:calcium/calmodulin-dependent 3p 5p-cyclic nucleotide phosphodiesterase 1C [Biomphalaria glabrata]